MQYAARIVGTKDDWKTSAGAVANFNIALPALRQIGSTERYWQNAVVASAYEGGKALHA